MMLHMRSLLVLCIVVVCATGSVTNICKDDGKDIKVTQTTPPFQIQNDDYGNAPYEPPDQTPDKPVKTCVVYVLIDLGVSCQITSQTGDSLLRPDTFAFLQDFLMLAFNKPSGKMHFGDLSISETYVCSVLPNDKEAQCKLTIQFVRANISKIGTGQGFKLDANCGPVTTPSEAGEDKTWMIVLAAVAAVLVLLLICGIFMYTLYVSRQLKSLQKPYEVANPDDHTPTEPVITHDFFKTSQAASAAK